METTLPSTETWLESADGTRLFARQWPAGESRGVVAIVHGYAEHIGRYDHVAAFLNGLGLDVFAIDLRGHGRSEGARGHVARFNLYLDDVDALLGWAEQESESSKQVLLGHSNGGLIALSHAASRGAGRYLGVIATAPFLGVAQPVGAVKALMGRLMSSLWPTWSEPSGIDPAILTHDEAISRAYAEDPLVFNTAGARWFTETTRAIGLLFAAAPNFDVPCLLMQGGDDKLVDPTRAKALHDLVGCVDKQYVEYPGFYHEIMNETEKQKVFGDIERWIEPRL